jgi:heat shock protein HslJ
MTESAGSTLDGSSYVSTGSEGHDLVPDSNIRLSFEDGRLVARAGCNTQGAAYDAGDGRLRWTGPPMGTRMACSEELMAQDAWLAELLTDGAEATLDGDDLTLTSGEVVLHLRREDPAGPVATGE